MIRIHISFDSYNGAFQTLAWRLSLFGNRLKSRLESRLDRTPNGFRRIADIASIWWIRWVQCKFFLRHSRRCWCEPVSEKWTISRLKVWIQNGCSNFERCCWFGKFRFVCKQSESHRKAPSKLRNFWRKSEAVVFVQCEKVFSDQKFRFTALRTFHFW